ncbi:MAG: hypothetical protein HYV68_03760 [Candidatus Taylorbacteria bacterium]|nr:hypothetical protein [Candidatus Taylorbacteria bacterium]
MKESKLSDLAEFSERRIGLEFENPILDQESEPIDFDELQKLWESFGTAGWMLDKDIIYGTWSGASKVYPQGTVNLSVDFGSSNFEMALPPGEMGIGTISSSYMWRNIISWPTNSSQSASQIESIDHFPHPFI